MNRSYSTAEVAKLVEVSKKTILRWLAAGNITEPAREVFGGVDSRVWSEKDLASARKYKEEHYRKRS